MMLGKRYLWLTCTWTVAVAAARIGAAADEPTATPPSARQPVDQGAADASDSAERANVEQQTTPPPPTAAEIAAWVEQLDDNRYLVREEATQRLLTTGVPALDALLEAANGDRPERADRALWVLRRLGMAPDLSQRRQALERLVHVKNRPQLSAKAMRALAEIRHREAVAAIEKLGGRFRLRSSQFGQSNAATEPYTTVRVIIDSQWRGGDAGLAHFRELLGLRQVFVVGADVTPSGLAELRNVALLEHLALYGTKLEPADVAKVQAVLPKVEIDYRRGGLLGVGASSPDGPPLVGTVQPESAAAAVGMRVGDLIQAFNGEPVVTFKDLTKKIGDCRPGDEIKLDVLRDGKTLPMTIKLGQWETI